MRPLVLSGVEDRLDLDHDPEVKALLQPLADEIYADSGHPNAWTSSHALIKRAVAVLQRQQVRA